MAATEHHYASDHPAAQGHFPGNPIIPGAVLLCDTLRAIEAALGVALNVASIQAAKFQAPTRPGDRVSIEFAVPMRGRLRFTCAVGGKTVLTGEALCDAIAAAN